MAPTPLNSPTSRVLPDHHVFNSDPSGGGCSNQVRRCESEATQTDDNPNVSFDDRVSSTSSSTFNENRLSSDSALDDSDFEDNDEESSSSVITRLSRRVGLLFSQNRNDRSTQTQKDPLTSETEKLAFDIVFFALGKRANKPKDDTTQCLRRSVTKMLEKHSLVFNSMVTRLNVTRDCDLHNGFQELSNELFQHNEVSWAKIIALFAFGARLAQYCQEANMNNLVFDVASNLSQYAVEKLTPFLRQNGGWNTLCEAFPLDSDYESTIWKSLVITGIGLTALATFLALHH